MLTNVLSLLHPEKRAMQKRLKLFNQADSGWLKNEFCPDSQVESKATFSREPLIFRCNVRFQNGSVPLV